MANENAIMNAMREVCNFFIPRDDRVRLYEGTVTFADGRISIDVPSPYIIVCGSNKNDGLYQMNDDGYVEPVEFFDGKKHPVDETFTGRVWFSYPPQDFLALCSQIAEYGAVSPDSNVVSESFGSSSRSYAQGSSGKVTWKERFGDSLRPYRTRMFVEVW